MTSTADQRSAAREVPELSIVVPAFNEAARLPVTLEHLAGFAAAADWSVEVIVVDDGSTDATAACAEAAGARVVRHQGNLGKGAAVRSGMLAARGSFRLLTDADLSTPIDEVYRLLVGLAAGYDVAIGSRAVAGATLEVRQSRWREAAGRLFNRLVRSLVLPGIRDTQCGFKLFTAAAAIAAFTPARLTGFAFDVEVLGNARRAGCRVVEVPVTWRNSSDSRVTLRSGLRAFADLVSLGLEARRGAAGQVKPSRSAADGG